MISIGGYGNHEEDRVDIMRGIESDIDMASIPKLKSMRKHGDSWD